MKAPEIEVAEYIELCGFCPNNDIAKRFNVSEMTVRRCLDRLEDLGRVRRVRSGAVSVKHTRSHARGLTDNLFRQREQKQAIASHAAALIREGQTIFLDTGSTCYYLAQEIMENAGITVITYSLDIVSALRGKPGIRVICPGGEYDATLNIFAGPHAETLLGSFKADLAFLGVGAIDPETGTQENTIIQTPLKAIMNANARHSYVLADSTKFGHRSYFDSIPISQIRHVITSTALEQRYTVILQEKGIQVETVEC
jgi:DeoR/GlpR family transcriptional regulator of sugar metabolism